MGQSSRSLFICFLKSFKLEHQVPGRPGQLNRSALLHRAHARLRPLVVRQSRQLIQPSRKQRMVVGVSRDQWCERRQKVVRRTACLDVASDIITGTHARCYFASGVGRTWNFTTFGRAPLPPSWCQGVYIE
jgi:hypothetical protein